MKLKGAEWKAFLTDKELDETLWKGHYVDEDEIYVNGVLREDNSMDPSGIEDTDTVNVIFGHIVDEKEASTQEGIDLLKVIRQWRKKQKVTHLVIEVENTELESVTKALKGMKGVRVLK